MSTNVDGFYNLRGCVVLPRGLALYNKVTKELLLRTLLFAKRSVSIKMASSSDGKPNNAPKKGKKIKLESIGQGGTSTSPQPTTGISDDERQASFTEFLVRP